MDEQPKVLTNEQKKAVGQIIMSHNAQASWRRQAILDMLNPQKDIDFECGYPGTITIEHYKEMYEREGLAERVVRIMPVESWALDPKIMENRQSEDTTWEKSWIDLERNLNLFHYLRRIDELSGIGQFGILLYGLNDGAKDFLTPVPGFNPVTGEVDESKNKGLELLYLRPFDQSVVKIKKREENKSSPRYGFPTEYEVLLTNDESDDDNQLAGNPLMIHWTRVQHVADNRKVSEFLGVPRMRSVFNRLLDIRKILSGSGEMFWKGAFPGFSLETDSKNPDVAIDYDSVDDEMEKYANSLQRYIALENLHINQLEIQVADPKPHLDAQIRYIAITLGIPFRVFMGSEQAHLASGQDVKTWNKRVSTRQKEYLTPCLLRPFIDRLMDYGVLERTEEYLVEWPDLNAPDNKEKADIAKIETETLASYTASGVYQIVPPKEFFTHIMKRTPEEVELLDVASLDYIKEIEEPEDNSPEDDTGSTPKG